MVQKGFFAAVESGNHQVVAQLLSHSPALLEARDHYGWTALHHAARQGHDTIVTQLLAASPDLIHAVDQSNQTVLHLAARESKEGHKNVVSRLLAASPSLIEAADVHGWTVLHCTCNAGNDSLAALFLALKPELAFVTNSAGSTPLHYAVRRVRTASLIRRLLELNPDALRTPNTFGETPLFLALMFGNEVAIEALQWKLTLDEIGENFEKFKPVVEHQCRALSMLLNQDVAGTVCEYLGFVCPKRLHNNKRI